MEGWLPLHCHRVLSNHSLGILLGNNVKLNNLIARIFQVLGFRAVEFTMCRHRRNDGTGENRKSREKVLLHDHFVNPGIDVTASQSCLETT